MTPAGTNLLLAHTAASGGGDSDVVTKSLRFNSGDTPHLSFTPSSTGNQKKWTTAFWFKRSKLTYNYGYLFGASSHSGNDGIATIYYDNTDKITSYFDTTGANPYGAVNDRLYRDPAGWMQIIWAVDAVNTEQRIWINGVEETLSSSLNPPDYAYGMNESGNEMRMGCRPWDTATDSFDGYYAQVVHLDGQYITDPTEFGQVSSTTGEWEPIEITSSSFTYGTNGALLEFLQTGTSADASGIGADTSGNGNHWSVSNLASSDVVEDTPTNNYCVLNPLDTNSSFDLQEGNLQVYDITGSNNYDASRGSMTLPSSGKWYWEAYFPSISYITALGISDSSGDMQAEYGPSTYTTIGIGSHQDTYNSGTPKYNVNVGATSGSDWDQASNVTAGSIFMVAVDMDNGSMWWGKDGSWFDPDGSTTANPASNAGAKRTGLTGTTWFPYCTQADYLNSPFTFNFGQDPTFAGGKSSGQDTSQSEFFYAPPSGFKALSTANLPTPTIAKPSEYFDTDLWSGDSTSTRNISTPFDPFFVWIKSRGNSGNGSDHTLWDNVRGVSSSINTSLSSSEDEPEGFYNDITTTANFGGVSAFGTQLYTLKEGVTNARYVNETGRTYVGWSWKGGSTDSFTGGAEEYNATSGISIIKWTGDSTGPTGEQDVDHNLGAAPELILAKNRTNNNGITEYGNRSWICWHKDLSADKYIRLDTSAAEASYGTDFGGSSQNAISGVTSSQVTFDNDTGTAGTLNQGAMMGDADTYFAILLTSVAGFSKIGKFSGTSSAFINCGFRPAFILAKRIDSTGNWLMFDDKREGYNVDNDDLMANDDATEATTDHLDILSNGFRIRTSDSDLNAGTVIYYAVASSPFKYANAR